MPPTSTHDQILALLKVWVPANAKKAVTSTQLFEDLEKVAAAQNMEFAIKPRSFAFKLREMLGTIRQVFRVTEKKGGGRKHFFFFDMQEQHGNDR